MPYSLSLGKEAFKFSSSHFTLFSADKAEHLHGHDYRLSVKVSFDKVDAKTEMQMDFGILKSSIKKVCDQLDEKILIPKNSPFLKIQKSPHYKNHTEVLFHKRIYCFPDDEIFMVPVSNITAEALARYTHSELKKNFPKSIKKISACIHETAGQGATYFE